MDFLEKFKVKLFKISSFEITDFKLIRKIAKTKKPVIVSTGMATVSEIQNCIKEIKKFHSKIILLHCVSGYPTSEKDANLNRIVSLRKKFKNLNIGLSDHTRSIVSSIASMAFGVSVIEKHFMLSKKLNSLDKEFSILPQQLKKLSEYSKKIFLTLGDGKFKIQQKERKSVRFRRSIYSVRDIAIGEKFDEKNINTFRPKIGIDAKKYFKVIGKKSKRNIKAYSPILRKDIKDI